MQWRQVSLMNSFRILNSYHLHKDNPLVYPTLYCEPVDIVKCINLPEFKTSLRRRSIAGRPVKYLYEKYWKNREKYGLFGKANRKYVPRSVYDELDDKDDDDDDKEDEDDPDRHYLFGSVYTNLSGVKVIDLTLPDGKLSEELEIVLSSGEISKVKIVNASKYTALLNKSVELGTTLSFKRGHVRIGRDLGRMFALGQNWKSGKLYRTCRDSVAGEQVLSMLTSLNELGEKLVTTEFREEHAEILNAEVEQGRGRVLPKQGSLGSTYMFSINLINACHLDNRDKSKSIGLWTESTPGAAENWYFVLPYVSYRGSCGVAIKLTHGMAISWDGRKIYHCTSFPTCPIGHEVYGGMWGSCGGTIKKDA